ncbi:hypothetical protein CANARDRAFT_201568 [[Candida] arabinofermentans NRRL YB-2248]|uniref:PAN2-PAN3 deadenylation complex subunit PAN3 n=1 Tax=[Candida] arabinofermentans NRRL YB-2248 TaxID=983967 RepID=A0A1E4SXH7_9ASCO|nr:hypothetical protein CANARDRAFT_201568 [[Candida] arabinofermentans NRRL YB-2248]
MSNSGTQFDWAKSIPCRNIQTHGFCKWENNGCSFNHDQTSKNGTDQTSSSSNTSPVTPKVITSSIGNLSMDSRDEPLGQINSNIPKTGLQGIVPITSTQLENSDTPKKRFNFDIPSFTPTGTLSSKLSRPNASSSNTSAPSFNPETAAVFTPGASNFTASLSETPLPHGAIGQQLASSAEQHHINYPLDEPFYQQTNLYPINYHLYAPQTPPHIQINKKPNERTVNDLFVPANLREMIQAKNEESLKSIPITQSGLPLHVNQYHSLYPIDQNYERSTKAFGYVSSIYKTMSNTDGKLYAMRRLEGVPITSEQCFKLVSKWKNLDCANVVRLVDAFTTRAFGDSSLILIYDYYPMSFNLMETHFFKIGNKDPELITEDLLWNYIVQLANATHETHKMNLTVGKFDPTKIIITNKGRIRLASCGLLDIVKAATSNEKESVDSLEHLKAKDIKELANLLIDLSRSTIFTRQRIADPNDVIKELKFSEKFKTALSYLLQEDAKLEDFLSLIAPQVMKIMNGLQNSTDFMEGCLSKEVENDRLVRLFAKLDFISERPEFSKDGSWSETGERFPIKLFKDYVFHQVDESGSPVIDLTRVIDCLNKLDAGVDENLLLVSPDENSCLIMNYRDLKELVEKSFKQLRGQ